MLFSSRIPLSSLVIICQAFRVGLSAGLPLVKVVQQQARRGPFASRAVLGRIGDRLEKGDSLEDVLKVEGNAFPPLFNGMVAVGEQAGGLPDVFRELERYFREQMSLKRRFWALAIWPIFQFCAGILTIVVMLLVLGWIAPSAESAFDPLGFGVGPAGAIRFLGAVAILLSGLFGLYFLATRILGQKAAVHRILLKIPGIGGCMHALALTRFCLAMQLTMETSLPTAKALKKCLRCTGNGAYEACADKVTGSLKRGHDVSETLTRCNIFPEEFLQIVATAEESGQLPEVMGRQVEHYQDVASTRLKVITMFANFGFWLLVAILIIWVIFRIALSIGGIYQDAMNGV
jgi:type II secretory pathway component PulF